MEYQLGQRQVKKPEVVFCGNCNCGPEDGECAGQLVNVQ